MPKTGGKNGEENLEEEMIEGFSRIVLMEPEIYLADTPSPELHKLLKRIDPKTADEFHPNDKRKIMRYVFNFVHDQRLF